MPALLAARIASGDCDAEAMQWLTRGLRNWITAGGAMPLERCLRLPNTPARMRRLQRDHWLRRAAREIDADGPWRGACALKAELDTFMSRGGWLAWRDGDAPPEGTSRLREALFYAVKLNDGEDLSLRAIQEIVGSVFRQKVRTVTPTLKSSEPQGPA